MFYCPGEYCSKRDICLHHKLKDTKSRIQLLDMSTEGSGYSGVGETGKVSFHQEYYCGDQAPQYNALWEMKTWQDKGDFENYHNPAHAEGWACPPGSLILIEDEDGEEKVIPFDPKTLKLSTKILDWHYEIKS